MNIGFGNQVEGGKGAAVLKVSQVVILLLLFQCDSHEKNGGFKSNELDRMMSREIEKAKERITVELIKHDGVFGSSKSLHSNFIEIERDLHKSSVTVKTNGSSIIFSDLVTIDAVYRSPEFWDKRCGFGEGAEIDYPVIIGYDIKISEIVKIESPRGQAYIFFRGDSEVRGFLWNNENISVSMSATYKKKAEILAGVKYLLSDEGAESLTDIFDELESD